MKLLDLARRVPWKAVGKAGLLIATATLSGYGGSKVEKAVSPPETATAVAAGSSTTLKLHYDKLVLQAPPCSVSVVPFYKGDKK